MPLLAGLLNGLQAGLQTGLQPGLQTGLGGPQTGLLGLQSGLLGLQPGLQSGLMLGQRSLLNGYETFPGYLTYIGGRANIQLCFPNGYPYNSAPEGLCYKTGFEGSANSQNGPCLAPVINGKPVVPCQGLHFTLRSYY